MRLNRDDRGITLVEVLVTVTLLAIIIVPLTNAMITYLRNSDAINDRLAASHDAQIAAAFFAQDVQSVGLRDWATPPFALRATSVEKNAPANSGNKCLLPAAEPTPNAVIRLAWDAPTSTSATEVVVVSYVVIQSGSEKQLQRLRCDGSGTLLQRAVVAHNLAEDPVATCFSAPNVEQACSGGSVLPQSILMPLKIRVQASTSDILTVQLFGQRRQTT